MATLRTLALGGIASMIFAYIMIFMVASYQINSGTPVNSTLRTQYNFILGNALTNGGSLFSNVSTFQKNTTNTIGGLNNNFGIPVIGPVINFVSSAYNIVGAVVTFIYDIPGIFNAFIYFVAIPFSAIMPTSFAIAMAYFMVLILALLAILSIIAIFPS